MNQIIADTNEIETVESQILADKQMEDAISELNSSQLALIGGGTAVLVL